MNKILSNKWNWLGFATVVAWVATLGSLFFSEVMKWTPCKLCWEQRIFMYPIAIILLVGIINKDKNVSKYVWPMVIIGGLISIYHNLLKWGIIPETCSATGPSCTLGHAWFGFITIPLLSLTAFVLIALSLIMANRKGVN